MMDSLPQDCIAKILSLTSPRDICRSSVVSKLFRSAAESDDVWNQFLPADFPAGFAVREGLPTRKRVFFSLVENPLLVEENKLSFSLERKSGKKCYMLAPRALSIVWAHDTRYWQWISLPNTRFSEVAELVLVWWLEISGKINLSLLSDDTLYAAYFVFRWNDSPYGFRQPVEASLALDEADDGQPSLVSLMQNPGDEEGHCAELRSDGWYEVELGQYYKRRGDLGEIKMSLKETKRPYEKKGLIVHGIELRPIP